MVTFSARSPMSSAEADSDSETSLGEASTLSSGNSDVHIHLEAHNSPEEASNSNLSLNNQITRSADSPTPHEIVVAGQGGYNDHSLPSVRLLDARLRLSGNNLYGLKLLTDRRRHIHRLIQMGTMENRVCVVENRSRSENSAVFQFMDLPVELILCILGFCDFHSLYCLTATSRTICNIVFPIFLSVSRLGLPRLDAAPSIAAQGIIGITTPEHALALCVWRRQDSFRSIGVLNLVLELPSDRVAKQVNSIISFFGSPTPLPSPFATMINIYISAQENVSLEASRLIYGLQRSNCPRLAITGFTRFSDFASTALDTLPLLEPTDTGYGNLEVFHAFGSFPFLPHILPFTMHNILNPGLRELDLNMNGFFVAKWAKFLQDLTFSGLLRLNLGGSISATSTLKFMRRNKKLREASFCGVSVPFVTPRLAKGFTLFLPDLRFIRAPSLYLCEILKYTKRPCSLSRIAVLADYHQPFSLGDSSTYRRSSVVALLTQVRKFPTINRIEFHFSMLASMGFCDVSGDLDTPPETLLFSVNILSFHKGSYYFFDNRQLMKLLDWISLFPSLSTVELWDSSTEDRSEWDAALRSKGILSLVHKL